MGFPQGLYATYGGLLPWLSLRYVKGAEWLTDK